MKNIVLTFHNVTDAVWFDKTIKVISKFYHFGCLDDLYKRLIDGPDNMPSRMCFITFDDGEKTVYEKVFPIIKKYNIPITLFVSPLNIKNGGSFWFQRLRQIDNSKVESMKRYNLEEINRQIDELDPNKKTNIDSNINIEMFNEMLHSGLVTYGAHTQNHPILSNENDTISKMEIEQSIIDLQQLTHKKVDYFAYPNGGINDFSAREIEYLKKMNIKLAFTTHNALVKNEDLYKINRVGITKGNSLIILCKIFMPSLYVSIRNLIK